MTYTPYNKEKSPPWGVAPVDPQVVTLALCVALYPSVAISINVVHKFILYLFNTVENELSSFGNQQLKIWCFTFRCFPKAPTSQTTRD